MFPQTNFSPYTPLPLYYSNFYQQNYPFWMPPQFRNLNYLPKSHIPENLNLRNDSQKKNLETNINSMENREANIQKQINFNASIKKLKKSHLDNNKKKSQNQRGKKQNLQQKQKKKKLYMTQKMIYRNKQLQKEIAIPKRNLRKSQKKKTRECISKQFKKEQKYESMQRVLEKNKRKIIMKRNRAIKKENDFLLKESSIKSIVRIPQNNNLFSQERISKLLESLKSRKYD